ncbi:hypothetical protein LCGC14_2342450, partial [marine sediment metagenome]
MSTFGQNPWQQMPQYGPQQMPWFGPQPPQKQQPLGQGPMWGGGPTPGFGMGGGQQQAAGPSLAQAQPSLAQAGPTRMQPPPSQPQTLMQPPPGTAASQPLTVDESLPWGPARAGFGGAGDWAAIRDYTRGAYGPGF